MGKIFYASDKDKITAGRQANSYARSYNKGVCWTPSREENCTFDESTGLWTCQAQAHHHEGSCGSREIHRQGRGAEWQIGWTWEYDLGGGLNKSLLNNEKDKFEENEASAVEMYEDASPEDYIKE